MIKHKHIEVRQIVVESTICNKCGKEHKANEYIDFVEVDITWGYNSRKDMTRQKYHLCEDCNDALVATFVIPPDEELEEGIIT